MEEMTPLETDVLVVGGGGGGAVESVNGKVGRVVLTASDVGAASTTALTTETNARMQADAALSDRINSAEANLTTEIETRVSADATLQANITAEASARQAADTNLQGQIDAISAASDVTDVVGTYAQLQAYDTSALNNNDIIKVLQDESQNDETTYYRWSTTTQTFTLIGEEGPYYTKAETNTLLNDKVDKVVGKGLSTNDFTNADQTKLASIAEGAEVNVQADWSESDTTADDYIKNKPTTFTGTDGTNAGASGFVPAPEVTDVNKYLKSDGTWATAGGGGSVETINATDWSDLWR